MNVSELAYIQEDAQHRFQDRLLFSNKYLDEVTHGKMIKRKALSQQCNETLISIHFFCC